MSSNPRYLGKRDLVFEGISCGGFSAADSGDTDKNINNLFDKGGYATAPTNSCSRVACYNTRYDSGCDTSRGRSNDPQKLTIKHSGIYFCNDENGLFSVPLSDIARYAEALASDYCEELGTAQAESGQAFLSDYGGYNIVVGYCNGNDPADVPPSAYTPPGEFSKLCLPNGSDFRLLLTNLQ